MIIIFGMVMGIDSVVYKGVLVGIGNIIVVFGIGIDIVYFKWNKLLIK